MRRLRGGGQGLGPGLEDSPGGAAVPGVLSPFPPEHDQEERAQRDRRRGPEDADQADDRERVLAGRGIVVVAQEQQAADRRADPPARRPPDLALEVLGGVIDPVEIVRRAGRRA